MKPRVSNHLCSVLWLQRVGCTVPSSPHPWGIPILHCTPRAQEELEGEASDLSSQGLCLICHNHLLKQGEGQALEIPAPTKNTIDSEGGLSSKLAEEGGVRCQPRPPLLHVLAPLVVTPAVPTLPFPTPYLSLPPTLAPLSPECPQPPPLSP